MPNMPILVMMPDRGPDTEEGAAGWASGSQECRGTRPALTPKPMRQSRAAMFSTWGESRALWMRTSARPRPPLPSSSMPGSISRAPPAHIR